MTPDETQLPDIPNDGSLERLPVEIIGDSETHFTPERATGKSWLDLLTEPNSEPHDTDIQER